MTSQAEPPTLAIVAGAAGAGKQAWTRGHRTRLPDAFYDADWLAEGLGGWDDDDHRAAANTMITERINKHLKKRESFGLKTTLEGPGTAAIIERAAQMGYAVQTVFIGTRAPTVNGKRVLESAMAHQRPYTPEARIGSQWANAQSHVARTASSMNALTILDNTRTPYREIARLAHGRRSWSTKPLPSWAKRLLEEIERYHSDARTTAG